MGERRSIQDRRLSRTSAHKPRRSKKKSEKDALLMHVQDDFSNFTVSNDMYMAKPVDLVAVRERMAAFKDYLKQDRTEEKMSRGVSYVLWQGPCDYANAQEAFRINAYDEQEGVAKLDRIRVERDHLQVKCKQLANEMVALEVTKIRYKRLLRQAGYVPRVVARSSGHPSNGYVYGYGYVYGIGYSGEGKTSTAPGFEFTATEHVKRLIRKFGPIIGQSNFDKLYYKIFDFKKRTPLTQRSPRLKKKSIVSFNTAKHKLLGQI